MPFSSFSSSKKKEWWEIPNTIAIYVIAGGLFVMFVFSAISNSGVVIGYSQLILIGLIVVLLLFRYFSEIKLGKFLELKKTLENVRIEQNQFRESTAEKIEEIKDDRGIRTPTEPEKIFKEATMPYEQKENLALRLLEDPNYKWRNRKTILRKTRMTDAEFEEFLGAHPEVVLSPLPDEYGNQLYGLKERLEKLQ